MEPTQRLTKLLDEHGRRLHRLLTRLTLRADAADDLLQDLFLKLRESATFALADDPAAFAVRTAVNLAFDWRRHVARRRDDSPLADDEPARPIDPLADLVGREEMDQVLAAIAQLPESIRLAIVLRFLERQDIDSVSRQLGRTPHQVRALCAKGLATLRRRLADSEVPDGRR